MLGLGETTEEINSALRDLRSAGVDFAALGQYLRPGLDQAPVDRYLSPGEFSEIGNRARAMGFLEVTAGPLVRSSYQENRTGVRRNTSRAIPVGRCEEDAQ